MNHLKPLSTSTHGFSKIFVHPKLDDCSHVFLRVDKVSPSLSQPYTGPHEVLSRNDKHITIKINGKKSCVSLDRVKPAFVFKDLPDTIPDPIISAESSHRHPVTTNMQTTKSGRRDANNISMKNITSCAAVGAPIMMGKTNGCLKLMKDNPNMLLAYCVINRKNLVAKNISPVLNEILNLVIKSNNVIKANVNVSSSYFVKNEMKTM
ncbi:integrase catalytic domain-containing protein [Trichonephila clavipes]|nr:integrase catalytic domain-containing protein [Trichonephila clavipes]